MKKKILYLILPGLLLLTLASCKKEEDPDNEIVNQELYELMKVVYLWNTTLPASIDPGAYDTPYDLMDDLRNDTYDRWSAVLTLDEFNQYFEEGVMIGHGFMAGLDTDGNIRIAFVYPTTQAFSEGIRRGWIVTRVNGTVATPSNFFSLMGESEIGITNIFTLIDLNGTTVTKTLTKEEVDIAPVVHYEVLEQGGDKIGYLVFQDFIEAANEQLDVVFGEFQSAGISDVIIDLRYNGGGSVEVAEHLASWLIGKDYASQPFVRYSHNQILASDFDTTINITGNTAGLSLDRIFFIGTVNTASASELMINGLAPYVESVLAGSNTHGKPVGMYAIPLEHDDYMVLPVSFKYSNAVWESDFYNGLPATLPAEDDLTRDFGDPEEASLRTILNYIETGAVPLKSTRYSGYPARLIESDRAINQFLKAY